jgi:hypothetical protein
MPAGTATLQNANPASQTVARSPQTTTPADTLGAFVRESRKCNQAGIQVYGNGFGQLISKSIKPAPGYLRGLWINIKASGGGGTAAVAAADAPWNIIQNLQLRDPFGSVDFNADGFGAYLIHMYSGQVGGSGLQDPTLDPSYSAIANTGNFNFSLYLPIEFDPDTAYGALPAMNAAAEMQLSLQLAPIASVFGTSPTTAPTIDVEVSQEYWSVPITNPSLTPPDDGSSHQWAQSQGANAAVSNGNTRIPLPDVGTYLSSIIGVFRDSTGARVDDPFNADLEMWVDGVPVKMENPNLLFARMFRQFGVARPEGVIVYTFRDSVGQVVGCDDMQLLLPTTPGTLLEVTSGAWGNITNSPAVLQTYTGKLYPAGSVPERVV